MPRSYQDIFKQQVENIEGNAPGCYNDLDMLIVGMHGKGNVGIGGCSDEQYLQHFAMWAFLTSPLIIGADIRSIDGSNKATLLNKGLIAINQDGECCPAFLIENVGDKHYTLGKILSGNRVAIGFFNIGEPTEGPCHMSICFDDLGIHSESGLFLKITDAITGEELGTFQDAYTAVLRGCQSQVVIAELVKPEK